MWIVLNYGKNWSFHLKFYWHKCSKIFTSWYYKILLQRSLRTLRKISAEISQHVFPILFFHNSNVSGPVVYAFSWRYLLRKKNKGVRYGNPAGQFYRSSTTYSSFGILKIQKITNRPIEMWWDTILLNNNFHSSNSTRLFSTLSSIKGRIVYSNISRKMSFDKFLTKNNTAAIWLHKIPHQTFNFSTKFHSKHAKRNLFAYFMLHD